MEEVGQIINLNKQACEKMQTNEIKKAFSLLLKAESLIPSSPCPNNIKMYTLINLSSCYFRLKNPFKALSLLVSISSQIEDQYIYACTLQNISSLNVYIGKNEEALENSLNSLKLLKDLDQSINVVTAQIISYRNIAIICENLKQHEKSQKFYTKACELAMEKLGPSNILTMNLQKFRIFSSFEGKQQFSSTTKREMPDFSLSSVRYLTGDRLQPMFNSKISCKNKGNLGEGEKNKGRNSFLAFNTQKNWSFSENDTILQKIKQPLMSLQEVNDEDLSSKASFQKKKLKMIKIVPIKQIESGKNKHKAAILIQKWVRGYLVRKSIEKKVKIIKVIVKVNDSKQNNEKFEENLNEKVEIINEKKERKRFNELFDEKEGRFFEKTKNKQDIIKNSKKLNRKKIDHSTTEIKKIINYREGSGSKIINKKSAKNIEESNSKNQNILKTDEKQNNSIEKIEKDLKLEKSNEKEKYEISSINKLEENSEPVYKDIITDQKCEENLRCNEENKIAEKNILNSELVSPDSRKIIVMQDDNYVGNGITKIKRKSQSLEIKEIVVSENQHENSLSTVEPENFVQRIETKNFEFRNESDLIGEEIKFPEETQEGRKDYLEKSNTELLVSDPQIEILPEVSEIFSFPNDHFHTYKNLQTLTDNFEEKLLTRQNHHQNLKNSENLTINEVIEENISEIEPENLENSAQFIKSSSNHEANEDDLIKNNSAVIIQKNFKKFLGKQLIGQNNFSLALNSLIKIQSFIRKYQNMKKFRTLKNAAIRIQKTYRMYSVRIIFKSIIDAVIFIQRNYRKYYKKN